MTAEASFRAMGSDAHVIVVGGRRGLLEDAMARIDGLEQRWSRFIADSEVSRLNRQAGAPLAVSGETVLLVTRAVEAWRISGGAFDPTVLGTVIRAGYDRSFDEMGAEAGPGSSPLGIGAADIVIDGATIRLPEGTGFDPGGIGKGLAADVVVHELLAAGAAGACVNLGGDVRVAGSGPSGGAWTVAVEHPWSPDALAMLGIGDGAVATSTTLRRRWRSGDVIRHHLIDPQTGAPSTTDVTLATVVAAEAWAAEVLAKAVLLGGAEHPFDILGGGGAQALVVDEAGAIRATPGLLAYLGDAVLPDRIEPVP